METYNRLYDNFPVWFGWKGMTGLEPMGETEMGWGVGWRGEKGRGTMYHAPGFYSERLKRFSM